MCTDGDMLNRAIIKMIKIPGLTLLPKCHHFKKVKSFLVLWLDNKNCPLNKALILNPTPFLINHILTCKQLMKNTSICSKCHLISSVALPVLRGVTALFVANHLPPHPSSV